MPMPNVEAERWRFLEQKIREHDIDVQRLWRTISTLGVGGTGFSDALTPTELAALTASGTGGSGEFVKVYTLAVRGNASAGTISWSAVDGGSPTTGTFAYDDDETDIYTDLVAFDAGVQVRGGTLLYNAVKIKFSDSTPRLSISSTSLTRADYGVLPTAELSYCHEPASWWE